MVRTLIGSLSIFTLTHDIGPGLAAPLKVIQAAMFVASEKSDVMGSRERHAMWPGLSLKVCGQVYIPTGESLLLVSPPGR